MLVYRAFSEEGSSLGEDNIFNNIDTRLQLQGISLDTEVFGRIQKDPTTFQSFLQDISVIESNPSEKSRFGTMYLKGFGQVVEIDGKKMTFSEISALPKEQKDAILDDKLSDDQLNAYQAWRNELKQVANQDNQRRSEVEKVANQEGKAIGTRIQVANQDNQTKLQVEKVANQGIEQAERNAKRLDEELQSSSDQIRSLSSLPGDIEAKALEEAEKNPPKELENIPRERYGEFKNIIFLRYGDKYETQIGKSLSPDDLKKFQSAIQEGRKILGIPHTAEFRSLTKSLVLGTGRDQIEKRGRELIQSGYSETVLWNPSDRTITFRKNTGETQTIETANTPPRERIEKNGISISRELPRGENLDDQRDALITDQKVLQREVAGDYARLHRLDGSQLPTELRSEGERHRDLYGQFERADTLTKRLEVLRELRMSNQAIDTKRRGSMTPDNLSEMAGLEPSIERERGSISRMIESLKGYILGEEKLKNYPLSKQSGDKFDVIARNNLSWLTDDTILFQRMGPDGDQAVDRIITEINRTRDDKNKIDLAGKNLDDTDKSTLKTAYQNLIENLGFSATILTNANIGEFQRKITETLGEEGKENSGRWESLLRAKSTKSI